MLLLLIDPSGISRGKDKMTSFLADLKDVTSATYQMNIANLGDAEAVDKEKTPPAENKDWNELHSASQGGVVAIIETMLSLGIDLNSKDCLGRTPLLVAAAGGKMQALNFLLEKGADPFLTTNEGRNLLHAAVEGGNVLIVETVLSKNIDINSKDDNGHTSLMIAAFQNKLEVVKYLLSKGADPLLKTKLGRNVLLIASQYGSIAVLEQLLSVVDINSRDDEGNTPLMVAAACANVQAVNYLLEKDADVLLTGQSGWSLLHFASHGGNVAIIETILSKGLDIDIKDNYGQDVTPLAVAVLFKNLEALNCLLNKGADPFVENNVSSVNSLHLAAIGGDIDIIKAILSRGFDINIRSTEGLTSLMLAAYTKNVVVVDCFLDNGADPTLRDNFGTTCLHYASQGGDVTIIKKCLSLGLDIESKDVDGKTPLMIAAAKGNSDAVEFLLERNGAFQLKQGSAQ